MKKNIGYVILFFVLLLGIFFKDFFYSIWIQKDFNLEKNIVLESDYQNLKREYEELLQTNNLKVSFLSDGIISKVILHDPCIFFEEITILKEKEEGIKEQDVILNEEGFVGTVSEVSSHSSQVSLLTNAQTKISVKVQNSYGILKTKEGNLFITDITSKEEIKKDAIVYTSSFTNIPGDIPIGKVTEVSTSSLNQEILVEPFVNFENLNYVVIKKGLSYE